MLSIITCSIDPASAISLKNNIKETIGLNNWEFLCIDNRNTNKGICTVYNEAAEKANGEILGFVHEDIAFKTKNWGAIIQNILKTSSNPGIVGVAGSTVISKTPAGWHNFYLKNENRLHIYQSDKASDKSFSFLNLNPNNENLSQVIAIDGVLMFVKKEIWKEFRFDDTNFKEFHYYDIDFSTRIARKYNNYVSYHVLIEHLSSGDLNKSWIKNTLIFEQKYKNHLPLALKNIPVSEHRKEDEQKLIHLLSNMVRFKYSFNVFLKYTLRLFSKNPVKALKLFIKRII